MSPMPDILARIEAYKREGIAAAKRARPFDAVRRDAEAAPPPRGFLAAIERQIESGDYALIAEIKSRYDPDNLFRRNQNIPPAERPRDGRDG